MTWVHWLGIGIGSWLVLSLPAALVFGRLLRSHEPACMIPVIADTERRPLPPALRAAGVPSVNG